MRSVALLLLTLPSVAIADRPAPWSAEIAGGVGVCGPRGAITCDTASPGFNVDLRLGKHLGAAVEVGLGVTHLSLPVDAYDSGSLWIFGPELTGHLAVGDAVDLAASLRIAAHHVAGVFDSGWGLGTVDLRLGGRYLFGDGAAPNTSTRWLMGLDYALTRPARTEVCARGACADADLALLHRLGLVVGLRFW